MNTATHKHPQPAALAPKASPSEPAPSAEERMEQALARIEASRTALILCLAPEPPSARRSAAAQGGDGGDSPSFAESLAARIQRNGLVQGSWLALSAVARRWWVGQPWHSSAELVGQTLMHQARPVMRRHPMATLAVGAAVGAGLVAARPWAWQQVKTQASPWRDRMGGLLWTQLSSAPVQMALAGALAAWVADQGQRSSARHAAAATTSDDSAPTMPEAGESATGM